MKQVFKIILCVATNQVTTPIDSESLRISSYIFCLLAIPNIESKGIVCFEMQLIIKQLCLQ